MSDASERKLLQYMFEARASELAMARSLRAQILMTPRGAYRRALETHINETNEHAQRLKRRMGELGRSEDALQMLVGVAESAVAQMLALSRAPLDVVHGNGGEEKILKNAKDSCAAEALEIATYTALEQLARDLADEPSAKLAASIRSDEEKMLARLLREIPRLTDAVVNAEVKHMPSYEVGETGAADEARAIGRAVKGTASSVQSRGRRTARKARRVPGVARVEGEVKGALASQSDLPISGYEELTAEEIAGRLAQLSQVGLAKVDAYERRHEDRSTILSRIATLRSQEPWPGYDELTVAEVRERLGHDEQLMRSVRGYERAHKNRTGVLHAVAHRMAPA